MDNEILVQKEAFEIAIKSIVEIVNNMESIKNSINTANGVLKENWQGESSEAFFEESETILNTFEDYNKGLSQLGEDLQGIYNGFQCEDINRANSIATIGENSI